MPSYAKTNVTYNDSMLELYSLVKEVFNLVRFDITLKKQKLTITLHLELFGWHEKPYSGHRKLSTEWLEFCVANNKYINLRRFQ